LERICSTAVGDFVLQRRGIERKDDSAAAVSANVGGIGIGGEAGAQVDEGGAGDLKKKVAVDASRERGKARLAQEFVDGRDLAKEVGLGSGSHGGISAQNQ